MPRVKMLQAVIEGAANRWTGVSTPLENHGIAAMSIHLVQETSRARVRMGLLDWTGGTSPPRTKSLVLGAPDCVWVVDIVHEQSLPG